MERWNETLRVWLFVQAVKLKQPHEVHHAPTASLFDIKFKLPVNTTVACHDLRCVQEEGWKVQTLTGERNCGKKILLEPRLESSASIHPLPDFRLDGGGEITRRIHVGLGVSKRQTLGERQYEQWCGEAEQDLQIWFSGEEKQRL